MQHGKAFGNTLYAGNATWESLWEYLTIKKMTSTNLFPFLASICI
jgi:hypothetical protein